MKRRAFLGGMTALTLDGALGAEPPATSNANYVLVGDSLAYQLGPLFNLAGKAYGVRTAYWAKGGSSARQWLVKKWFERVYRQHPKVTVFVVSLGTNCTRVERPRLADDISRIVNLINDFPYEKSDDDAHWPTVAWLLPPPLAMNTQYLHDAVAKSEVFAFGMDPVPLESDGIHPTARGRELWMGHIAETLWG